MPKYNVEAEMATLYDDESQSEESLTPLWKSHLYQVQLQAPKPKVIRCRKEFKKPNNYGEEYHGLISREESERFVMECEGCYLTRERQKELGTYALTFRFGNLARHYRLYYDEQEKTHYVGDKRFDSIHDLVEDGLITLYVEINEKDYINQMTLDARRLKKARPAPDFEDNRTGAADKIKPHSDDFRPIQNSFKASECEKAHNFKINTYYGFQWCFFCRNFMWGLKNQGVRCLDCSFDCHSQCSELVPHDCCPDKKLVKRVFGVDLTTLIKAHNQRRPIIIDSCIKEIEKRGLEEEGLYRIPGFADSITDLKNIIDKDGVVPDLSTLEVDDVNVICGLLKLYLRELPVPIITFDLYDRFIEAAKLTDKYKIIKSLSEAIKSLPRAHYETLKYICRHLQRVAKFKNKNLMTPENLGIVFGPTLMRVPDHLMLEAVGYIPYQKKIVQYLIEEQDVLFET